MSFDAPAFKELSAKDPEGAWKALEKAASKGALAKSMIQAAAPSFFSAVLPSVKGTDSRKLTFQRLIRHEEIAVLSALFARMPSPESSRAAAATAAFGAICEARSEKINDFFFPSGKQTTFTHKQWEQAILRKNMHLLEKMQFPVDHLRAITFIENYFFDLQLTQLKYLEPFIDQKKWPLRFARDAIIRRKGPATIAFFVAHGLNNDKISHVELWETLAASIKTGNHKAFDTLLSDAKSALDSGFDWQRAGMVGDIFVATTPAQELRLLGVHFPAEFKKATLLELAVIRGETPMAQQILDFTGALPEAKRVEAWKGAIHAALTKARAAEDDILLVQAKIQSAMDFLSFQNHNGQSAAADCAKKRTATP